MCLVSSRAHLSHYNIIDNTNTNIYDTNDDVDDDDDNDDNDNNSNCGGDDDQLWW